MRTYKSIDFTIRKSGDLILALLKLSNLGKATLEEPQIIITNEDTSSQLLED